MGHQGTQNHVENGGTQPQPPVRLAPADVLSTHRIARAFYRNRMVGLGEPISEQITPPAERNRPGLDWPLARDAKHHRSRTPAYARLVTSSRRTMRDLGEQPATFQMVAMLVRGARSANDVGCTAGPKQRHRPSTMAGFASSATSSGGHQTFSTPVAGRRSLNVGVQSAPAGRE